MAFSWAAGAEGVRVSSEGLIMQEGPVGVCFSQRINPISEEFSGLSLVPVTSKNVV